MNHGNGHCTSWLDARGLLWKGSMVWVGPKGQHRYFHKLCSERTTIESDGPDSVIVTGKMCKWGLTVDIVGLYVLNWCC